MFFWIGFVLITVLGVHFLGVHESIVKLSPPQISSETILEKIICTRPMREGNFNLSLEQRPSKTVVHCYGHGASGWSTLFGSVNEAIDLFKRSDPNKNSPIRIVGAGCMGLTMAIELSRQGYRVAGIKTKNLYDTASWKAGGYFGLDILKTHFEEQTSSEKIGIDTFIMYQKIYQGEHPYISKEAVKYLPVYSSHDTEAGIELLERHHLIPARENVAVDFGNGQVHHGYVKWMSYFIHPSLLMKQLIVEVERLGIPIEIEEIKSFDEIGEKAVFNCAGLGATQLNSDDRMVPVRGHLVALKPNFSSPHLDYMIYTKVKQDNREESLYMLPKNIIVSSDNKHGSFCAGIFGGTFIKVDGMTPFEQEKLDRIEFEKLLNRLCEFFLGKPFN